MFDKFFEHHKPKDEELLSFDSSKRINDMLRNKIKGGNIGGQNTEVISMKKKHVIRGALISAAAAITAAITLITVNADFKNNDKYIVRVNNIWVEHELSTYVDEDMTYDVVTFKLPCEIFVSEDGGPIDPDTDNEFRKVTYYTGNRTAPVELPDGTVTEMTAGGRSGWIDSGSAERMIPGLPYGTACTEWAEEGKPSIIEITYDTEFVKQYWENYQKENPDTSMP